MKVLFLDIDGVLNSIRSCHALDGYPHDFSAYGMRRFDQIAVALIRKLCEETDTSVCLSSTWRMTCSPFEAANGLNLPIFGCTPVLNGPRGKEIAAFLETRPDITRYAIVDDDSDMLSEQKPYFVQTDHKDGLRYDDYLRLRELLK